MRVGFKTTIEENLIKQLKIEAIQNNVDVNDILEKLIDKFLKGEIQLNLDGK
ncbi:MAG: hypothetical protein KBF12_02805 [Sebaldella sp.]|nr:hypothetical protein [Sebaldella sp.]